jgi:hypothetical protein
MLVLAMEFSRDARRACWALDTKNRPVPGSSMDGREAGGAARQKPGGPTASRRRDGIAPGCSSSRNRGSLPQNGIVMPIANHRAHRPHERDIRRCAVRQGRDMGDSE